MNNLRPVHLPTRVVDARGHDLEATGVRYQRTNGAPMSIAANGIVTCNQAGDATVRASLASVVTNIVVRCRPVRKLTAARMLELTVGAPPEELPFEAEGLDGKPVSLLSGQLTIDDSTIATIEGQRVRARAPGGTHLTMRVGDREAMTGVLVYGWRSTPERLKVGERVAIAVRLAQNEFRRWTMSPGLYWVAMLPDDERPIPGVTISGANCGAQIDPQHFFCLAKREATITVFHPQATTREVGGALLVWRHPDP